MRKKKHLNRIAVDLCTPTAERRPTTAEDIRNDVFIEDFSNSEELYEFVLDLTDMTDEDVIYELDGDDTVENKIKYLLGFYDDPSDGSPNIQYCCVDGKELDNVLRYDAFDGLNFDDADSETLADILLDEYEYSEDDDDEWDDEDDLNEEKEKKKNLNKGETKMKNAEKKYYVDFVLKGTAEVYAHDFEEAEDIVQELFDEFYYGNDSDSFPHELADGIESIEIDDVELDTDDDDYDEDDLNEEKEKKIVEDMDFKYREYSKLYKNPNKGKTKMIDNRIKKFAKILEKNGFEDNGMDSSLEVTDNAVTYKDQGGYFKLTLVDEEEKIYTFKERDHESQKSSTLVIRGDKEFEEFLKDFKRDHVLDL